MTDRFPSRSRVLRRRGSTTRPVPAPTDTHFLTQAASGYPVGRRLRICAKNLETCPHGQCRFSKIVLRPDQEIVFKNLDAYVSSAADRVSHGSVPIPWGRFVQPPGTGKSVLIAEAIARSGAHSLVLVPRAELVDQMVAELREKLIDVPVGIFSGDEKAPVSRGVNVSSYQMMIAHFKAGTIPASIADATIVFCDEAHESMTELRQMVLQNAFDERALRIGCTATPDYNDQRALVNYFPELIHQITLLEAESLGLFAPMLSRVLVARVDGSTLRLKGRGSKGDFDPEELGAIMADAEFLEATRRLLWETDETAGKSVVIFCSSIERQAKPLLAYLRAHCPKDEPRPVLVTADTPKSRRRSIRKRYSDGKIRVLINVNIFTLGWNMPRCKVLIDLSPTISEVRAGQKYFRITRPYRDMTAIFYVLLPRQLSRVPIFPQTLFGRSIEDSEDVDEWIQKHRLRKGLDRDQESGSARGRSSGRVRIASADVDLRVQRAFDSRKVRLDPYNRFQVGRVISTRIDLHNGPLPRFRRFREMYFEHSLFSGYGAELMRFCGFPRNRKNWNAFGAWAMPDLFVNSRFKDKKSVAQGWCQDDVDHLLESILEKSGSRLRSTDTPEAIGYYALTGGYDDRGGPSDPESALLLAEDLRVLKAGLGSDLLTDRQRYVLQRRYMLGGDVDLSTAFEMRTLGEVGKELNLSKQRVRQIEREGIWRLYDKVLISPERDIEACKIGFVMQEMRAAQPPPKTLDHTTLLSEHPSSRSVVLALGPEGTIESYGCCGCSDEERRGVLLFYHNAARSIYVLEHARWIVRFRHLRVEALEDEETIIAGGRTLTGDHFMRFFRRIRN